MKARVMYQANYNGEKALGFKWHSKKECWYKAPAGYRKIGRFQ